MKNCFPYICFALIINLSACGVKHQPKVPETQRERVEDSQPRTPEEIQAAFLSAIEAGDVALVKKLLDEGARVNEVTKIPLATHVVVRVIPLLQGVKYALPKTTKLLIQQKANVEEKDICDRTALTWAVLLGQRDVARLLIRRGADMNHKSDFGYTVMMWGMSYEGLNGDISFLKILLDAPQDFNLKSNIGWNVLEYATHRLGKATTQEGKQFYQLAIAQLKHKMRS